jgi:hypothetical protein
MDGYETAHCKIKTVRELTGSLNEGGERIATVKQGPPGKR